jgi:hypothetical protein
LLVLAGCEALAGKPPDPTPLDFPGIAGELSQRGIRVDKIVSGDSGCDDRELGRTAIRFEASGLDQTEPATVYVYILRNHATFDRLLPDVARCATRYVTDPHGEPWIAASPFVMTGPGPWAPRFRQAMAEGLTEAAGNGG